MIALIRDYGPQLLRGAWLTIVLAVVSMLIAMVVGLGIALLSSSRFLAVRILIRAYVDFFRGTPLLLQLFFIYFVFPEAGVYLSPVVAGVSALSLNYAAYLSEVYRATIDAVDHGQWESATTLGMSRALAFRRIVFPQAFKIAVPPVGNYFIAIFKDTALVSTITVQELMFRTDSLASTTYEYLPLYTVAFVMYFAISYPASLLVRWFERRLSRRVSVSTPAGV
ncbi:amino acid ABC transporter permease [Phytohabitans aurantiacus]|uniref:Ectoine/hydroxyectoine ABC transporter permease subunit EhuD n=1 Tax=Phytohabitans aurantiacus TaxID=3016789 RepID=A0ABQ5RBB2_9ACTN|nr:amino acid ABC transporter permease [Phytohabitans aurantiacus]GLI03863.1 ectoine/hydroxyectoine ABC transporter permease subunit EhuD [Phytohabitans aurantiacus]